MAKTAKPPKGPNLKVYSMPAGFYDAVVAAPSQAAALRAWGIKTDLFAAGRASIVEEEAVRAEALARPGAVIKRMRGDEAAMLGPEPAEPFQPRTRGAPSGKRGASPQPTPPPRRTPDRSKLDAAERALAQAETAHRAVMHEYAIERADLDRRESAARHDAEKRLSDLRGARDLAAAAFKRAANDNG